MYLAALFLSAVIKMKFVKFIAGKHGEYDFVSFFVPYRLQKGIFIRSIFSFFLLFVGGTRAHCPLVTEKEKIHFDRIFVELRNANIFQSETKKKFITSFMVILRGGSSQNIISYELWI